MTAKADPTAGVTVGDIIAEDIVITPRHQSTSLWVATAGAEVIFNQVVKGPFFHLDTFIALSIENIVMNMVFRRAIGFIGRVFAIIPLFGRGAEIDAFAIFAAIAEDKIPDAAILDGIMVNVSAAHKVAQPDALAAGIEQGHVFDLQPLGAAAHFAIIGGALAVDIQQLVAIIGFALTTAVVAIDGPAIQQIIIVEDLEDATTGRAAPQHCCCWPC